jgi:hypothetical protein
VFSAPISVRLCVIFQHFFLNFFSGGKRMTDGNGEAADNGVAADVAELASAIPTTTFTGEL